MKVAMLDCCLYVSDFSTHALGEDLPRGHAENFHPCNIYDADLLPTVRRE